MTDMDIPLDSNLTTQAGQLKTAIEQAELIIIGAGSGLSASAGICYDDFNFFNTIFSKYHERYGLQTINEAEFFKFPTPEEQYAFWARFISVIRYKFPPGKLTKIYTICSIFHLPALLEAHG